ncbi:TetR/AcrR family transcriptional regulator [Paenibacillus cellulositrophicus]|jgi:AcrR family transcriptional regulator|uniref:AcrR family transcriptional regulator n=3 Tax=Paenibacillus TaxID=44249 RepID=A0A1R1EJL5_9BACL|nr:MULTISPECIES: TetR/AcrR family transcriptional regulator [Paenibacillus]MBB3129564.1 AcrR family transcriptional regulator [Paenibacillus rhizosphaerae]MBJ9991626.1 TetR/AcrR family transcriptional regulator [Paenibacillus sp. S28]MCM2996099.1 TetR/AcrR family transcriptional regulator [Paenibacillus cellulositrophicus]MEC0178724.1 TetR/AcrR family transcriptional regulator [Paenibacillus favisporus]OMF52016.1 TetR family transcriptional regulator [Paenibacillus rhizosphaerae]
MARRAVEQELSRERILEAARHLFVTKGYRAISMRSIGQHLGYSHGSLYYHFKEKAELFYAIVVEDFNNLAVQLNKVLKVAPTQDLTKVEQLMLEFIRFGLDHPYQYEIMFMIRDEELLSYCRSEQGRCFELFASMVRRYMNEEEHGPDHCRNLPLTLFLSMHGFISYYIQDRVTFEEIKPAAITHVKICCRSLR